MISVVRLEDLLALVLLDRREASARVDGRQDRQVLALARAEVVLAVAGRRVDEARAGVHRDVVGGDDAEGARCFLGRRARRASERPSGCS